MALCVPPLSVRYPVPSQFDIFGSFYFLVPVVTLLGHLIAFDILGSMMRPTHLSSSSAFEITRAKYPSAANGDVRDEGLETSRSSMPLTAKRAEILSQIESKACNRSRKQGKGNESRSNYFSRFICYFETVLA